MSLPKALLCILDSVSKPEQEEEKKLREAGFATATVSWAELNKEPNAWMQLTDILNDESVCAWVISGAPDSYTTGLMSKVSLLTLALDRPSPPATAFVLRPGNASQAQKLSLTLPDIMRHIKIYHKEDSFAGRLAAARFQPKKTLTLPFYIKAHLSSLIGVWLELGPWPDEVWPGFMFAVTGSAIDVLGVGPEGFIPKKCCLEYPILNIEGTINETAFNGCAAKNVLTENIRGYIRLNGCPDKLIIAEYPGADKSQIANTTAFN